MIQANHVLKEIFEELKYMMPGSEELNSTSRLSAAGDGKALLMGSFTLNMHLEKGDDGNTGAISGFRNLYKRGLYV